MVGFFWAWLSLVSVASAQGDDNLRELGLHGFSLGQGEVLLPRQEPGVLDLIHRAQVEIVDAGLYRFHVESEGGQVQLAIQSESGASYLIQGDSDWMPFGEETLGLELHFKVNQDAGCRVRVLWEREWTAEGGFLPEPLPDDVWLPAKGIARHDDMPDRLLLEQKGCSNCHLPSAESIQAVGQRLAPDLRRAGQRLGLAWMQRWIADPRTMHPSADMPALLLDAPAQDLEAVAGYLGSLRGEGIEPGRASTEDAVLAQGRRLYHGLGCVACHGPLEAMAKVFQDPTLARDLPNEVPSAPFGDLRGKWFPAALADFLRDPVAVYPDARMPSMGLSDSEADLLASYLVSVWGAAEATPLALDSEQLRRGMGLFESTGCGACHRMEEVGAPGATPLAELRGQGGCLDSLDSTGPNYGLSGEEVTALARGIRAAQLASGAPAPLDQARRSLQSLNCFACHAMDARGGPPESWKPYFQVGDERVDLGDEGRLPPDLSGIGWKLTTTWLHGVLVEGRRARPYLMARMPNYAEQQVADLPRAFAGFAGLFPDYDVESPEVSDAEVQVGRELMGREALSCVTCHSFGELDPLGSPGPALDQFGERLRYEWARSFLRAPQRFKPGSRMPDFYAAGKSTLHSVYDGDLGRQVDAMWAYFGLGEFMPPPPGMEAGRSLQILVGERPIVMRAFLEGSGSRAIAVGNPNGGHYAFDAEKVCLSEVWQGDFLDASGSWAGRGGSPLGGRGEGLWEKDEGVPLQMFGATSGRGNRRPPPGGKAGGYRFRGYRLDASGQPSFLYDVQGQSVEERVEVQLHPELRIRRSFSIIPQGLTGVTLNAMELERPSVRFRVDTGSWQEPTALPSQEGRAYFHLVVPAGATSVDLELELRP